MHIVRLIIVAALLTALPWQAGHAATPISKEEANAYYGQCIKTPDARMSPNTKNEFCACTSAHMMQTMSAEDVKVMQQKDSAARVMTNKMMVAVQGPCISAPLEELHYAQCQNDPRIALAAQQVSPDQVCGCISARMGEWLEQAGPDVVMQTIAENPFVTDPLKPVMESTVYKQEAYEVMLDCLAVAVGRKK